MSKTKCKEDKDSKGEIKPAHKYVCKKCGRTAKKEDKLCKPKKIK